MERNKPLFLFTASLLFFALVTVTAYYKRNGLQDLRRLEVAISGVVQEIEDVRQENIMFRRELNSLNYSNAYVEAIARESLGLVKPGEVVYEFVPASVMVDHKPDLARSVVDKSEEDKLVTD